MGQRRGSRGQQERRGGVWSLVGRGPPVEGDQVAGDGPIVQVPRGRPTAYTLMGENGS